MSSFSELTMVKYVEAINTLAGTAVDSLSDAVLTFLISPTTSNIQADITQIATDHRLNLSAVKLSTQGLLVLYQEAIHDAHSAQSFEDRCRNLGINTDAAASMSAVWKRNAVHVATSLLSRAVTNNQLVDMDWIFGVTAASDDCNHVGKTFLQLKLTLESNTGRRVVLIELSLEQFYQFLASLEKCKSYLDYVSPQATSTIEA